MKKMREGILDGKLQCTKCKKWKPATLEFFRSDKRLAEGLFSWCKVCQRHGDSEYRRKDPLREKNRVLKKLYGITLDEYNKLLNTQDGKCKICKSKDPKGRKNSSYLHVDHIERNGTRIIRGLLCAQCNAGLGKFKDEIALMERAIKYIQTDGELQKDSVEVNIF